MTATTAVGLTPLELDPPADGGDSLRHDPTFERWDAVVCEVRDTVNLGIDAVNAVGAGLPRLPEGSLRELLVEPLVGDHAAIRRNAEACAVVRTAMLDVAGNQLRVVGFTDDTWRGQAATAFRWRVRGRAAATGAVGALVTAAVPVFEGVADFCERMQVRVEELVVELGERVGRLAKRVLSRVSGPLGWGVFAADVLTSGFDAITDIVDDVRRILELVDTLLGLQDEVVGFVADTRARLETLLDLPGLLRAVA